MVTREKLRKVVFGIIAKQLGSDEQDVSDDSDLRSDLGSDSLDDVELILVLEEKFDIEIPDEESQKIAKVGEVVEAVWNKLQGKEVE